MSGLAESIFYHTNLSSK